MRSLRRILRHLCAGFCATFVRECLREIIRCDRQVVLPRDSDSVAAPGRHHVRRMNGSQFRGSAGPHVLPEARPWRQTCLLDNPLKLRAEIYCWIAVAGDDMLAAFVCEHKRGFKECSQSRKKRNNPRRFALPSRLRTANVDSTVLPIDVSPSQGQDF